MDDNAMKNDPSILMDWLPLSEGEVMTLWVALQTFSEYLHSPESDGLGPIRENYKARVADIERRWLRRQTEQAGRDEHQRTGEERSDS